MCLVAYLRYLFVACVLCHLLSLPTCCFTYLMCLPCVLALACFAYFLCLLHLPTLSLASCDVLPPTPTYVIVAAYFCLLSLVSPLTFACFACSVCFVTYSCLLMPALHLLRCLLHCLFCNLFLMWLFLHVPYLLLPTSPPACLPCYFLLKFQACPPCLILPPFFICVKGGA